MWEQSALLRAMTVSMTRCSLLTMPSSSISMLCSSITFSLLNLDTARVSSPTCREHSLPKTIYMTGCCIPWATLTEHDMPS